MVEVGATASAAGYAEVSTGLLLGVATEGARSPADAAAAAAVTSADGEVVLLAPAGVLPTGATVQMTELFDGLAALAAATRTSVATPAATPLPVVTAPPQATETMEPPATTTALDS